MSPVPSSTSVLKPVCRSPTRREEYQSDVSPLCTAKRKPSAWAASSASPTRANGSRVHHGRDTGVIRRSVIALQEIAHNHAPLHFGHRRQGEAAAGNRVAGSIDRWVAHALQGIIDRNPSATANEGDPARQVVELEELRARGWLVLSRNA